jgi:hypothetical protein
VRFTNDRQAIKVPRADRGRLRAGRAGSRRDGRLHRLERSARNCSKAIGTLMERMAQLAAKMPADTY